MSMPLQSQISKFGFCLTNLDLLPMYIMANDGFLCSIERDIGILFLTLFTFVLNMHTQPFPKKLPCNLHLLRGVLVGIECRRGYHSLYRLYICIF